MKKFGIESDIAKIVVHRKPDSRKSSVSVIHHKTIASTDGNPGNPGCARFPASLRRLLRYWEHHLLETRSFYIANLLIFPIDPISHPGMPLPGTAPSRTIPSSWYPSRLCGSSPIAAQKYPVGQ